MRHKIKLIQSLKTWAVIYPSITILLYTLGHQLKVLPLFVQTFVLTVLLVPFVVFAGIPLVELLLKFVRQKIKSNSYEK